MASLTKTDELKLEAKLEELYKNRQIILRWEDLYIWYGVQKISSRTYRDILERWRAYLEDHDEEPAHWEVTVSHKKSQGVYEAIFRVDLDEGERALVDLAGAE
jgi:hypothetical protein